jgi:hypothetical protein
MIKMSRILKVCDVINEMAPPIFFGMLMAFIAMNVLVAHVKHQREQQMIAVGDRLEQRLAELKVQLDEMIAEPYRSIFE